MASTVRKYKFNGLPHLSREQVVVVNSLLCHLPQTPFERGFKDRLRAVLEPLVHADVDIWLDGVTSVAAGDLPRVLATPMCTAVVGLVPRPQKALLEVDLTVAQACIDRILGGNAEDVDVQRPLSEIEDGVFSFVLLKALALVQHAEQLWMGQADAGVVAGFGVAIQREMARMADDGAAPGKGADAQLWPLQIA